jgi:diacylglycerol O-acyltransferase / wax synthase
MSVSRLSPLDASFLTVETPTAHMHVGWAAIFDPPAEGRPPAFEELRDHIVRRLPRAPRYRQMIHSVPFGINAPVWVDDPDFDVSRHVVEAESDRLAEVVSACMSEPLPRDHPLWQVRIAPRLDDGRILVVGKAHHCMVDGIAAVELASLLVDPEPDPPEPEPESWMPQPIPGAARLVSGAVLDFARDQLDLVSLPARVVRSPGNAAKLMGRAGRAAGALLDAARPAVLDPALNPPLSGGRHLGFLARPLDELLGIKAQFGVKLNDTVLAASAGAVRRFLAERGERPPALKTMVPVNVRGGEKGGTLGNRISFMFVDLPCDEPDPVRRLLRVHEATRVRKRSGVPEGADAILRSMKLAPTPVRSLVSRMVASPRTFNLVVSNIPGPREPLYMRGCPLVEAYPVVPLADRHALAIGMTTVGDMACFGLYADRARLPDIDELAAYLDSSLDELLDLSGDVPVRGDPVAALTPPG